MKIKEVCRITNLTERTIRFYVEKGLIVPYVEMINGREYRNYSEDDVDRLKMISELRKLLFSIDAIAKMLNNPKEIQNVLQQHQLILLEEYTSRGQIIEAIKKIDILAIHSVRELVDALKYLSINYNLPVCDIEPCFGRNDLETEEEKAILSDQVWRNIRKRNRNKIIITAVIIFILTVGAFSGSKIYKYQNQMISTGVFIPSIKFTKIFQDKNNTLIGQFQVFEKGFYDEELRNCTLNTRFEEGLAGYLLYKSILTNQMYAAIRLEIEMKRVTAVKLGLIDQNDASKLDVKRILLNEELSKKYTKILDLQGDIH